MQIKCRRLMEGPGPSEAIVSIVTTDGQQEEVVVYTGSLQSGSLEVGPKLDTRDGETLVELPRESASGRWRVWVPEAEIVKDRETA